jgi:Asp/Glu/hydantoin racemase
MRDDTMSDEEKTVFILHTSFSLVDVLNKLFGEQLPAVRIVNIIDDSLLDDVRAAGSMTASVARRLVGHALLAESAGADLVFNSCSSVGEAADMMREMLDIPVVKIDERMANDAVSIGGKVAVIATLPTTLDPTVRFIQRKADTAGKQITVNRYLVEGAFDVLMSGDSQKHDQMVSDEIERAVQESDVVILAQASMARLAPQLEGKTSVPLLTSLSTAVEEVAKALKE